jgi:endonuclease/exonuclease/phosphatase (EEP) superfamily protein YafD
MNATMDHASLRGLVTDGFQDAATQARSGWQPTWPSAGEVSGFGVPAPPLIAIDHVLVRGGLRAVRTTTYEVDGTDHRALVARLVR